MDSRSDNRQFRSVPLIQRDGKTLRSNAYAARGVDASTRDEVAQRRPRAVHVSAYPGESTAGEVTTRSARRTQHTAGRRSTETRGQRHVTGFALVDDEPARDERTSYGTRAERGPRDERATHEGRTERRPRPERAPRGERVAMRRNAFVDDDAYEYESDHSLSGSQSRRSAIIDALCFIPETVGEFTLGLIARVRAGGVLACALIAFTVLMLYAPVRDLYVTNRKLDALQETYDALLAENDSIRNELEALQTREGIENEARERGYVLPGETKVVIDNLTDDMLEEPTSADEQVDTRPWYTRVLDAIFGYEPEG